MLVREVLEVLAPREGQIAVDGTLGHGGHTLELLRRVGPMGHVVAFDRDPWMLDAARRRIAAAGIEPGRYTLIEADHAELPQRLDDALGREGRPDMVLLDVGPSTPQLLDPARGMSWESDRSLDMRMRPMGETLTAASIVNDWPAGELACIFRDYADERWARRIAQRIVEERAKGPIETGRQLGRIVGAAIPRKAWPPKIHPATRVFLALRIEVNGEYRTLERILPAAFERLAPGGRLAVITFHGGEHRIARRILRELCAAPEPPWPLPNKWRGGAPAEALTRKALTAREDELERNPRARSAQLRAIRKRGGPDERE